MFRFQISAATLFLLTLTAAPVTAIDYPLLKVLPLPACTTGWNIDGKPDIYNRDNLFDRIDGEAEIYFPYGFETLISARYVNENNPKVAIEADVYKMGSVLDAFGIYANYRRVDDAEISIGSEGIISPAQLLFYQDRYFIRLQASGTLNMNLEILRACATAISRKLPPSLGKPTELDALKINQIVQKSHRYIAKSLLGYSFFGRGLMADAYTGKGEFQIFIVLGDSADAAGRSLLQYRDYLQASGAAVIESAVSDAMSMSADDPLYGSVRAQQCGNYIVGAVRIKHPAEAKVIIGQICEKLAPAAAGSEIHN